VEDVFPANPVFYFRASNISQRLEHFTATRFWHDLKALDYKKLAVKMGTPTEAYAGFQRKMAGFFSPENQMIFKALFGQEVAVAVYAGESANNFKAATPAEVQKLFTDMAGNIFIATRVGPQMKAAEAMAKLGGQFSKDIAMSTTPYKGKAINLITTKDGSITFGYVRLNDFVVMGVGEKAARLAIDVAAKSHKSLSQSESFLKRKRSFVDGADTAGFFELQAVSKFLQEQISEMAKARGHASPSARPSLRSRSNRHRVWRRSSLRAKAAIF